MNSIFKLGTQKIIDKYLESAEHNSFYITTDTHNLYFSEDGKLELLSQCVKVINNKSELPTTATKGSIVYTMEENSLYIFNGTEWKPINNSEDIKQNAYEWIKQVADYLFEVQYTTKNIDYDYANDYFKHATKEELKNNYGYCTGVLKDGKVLRHLDWYYNNEAEFVVHRVADPEAPNSIAKDKKGIYGSIGIASGITGLTKDIAESGTYNKKFKMVPFITTDGINDAGLYVQQNVVPDNGIIYNINPSGKEECAIPMMIRFILDHCATFEDVEKVFNTVHIYSTDELKFGFHYLIAKGNDWRVIELTADGHIVVGPEGTLTDDHMPHGILSNFRTTGLKFNDDNVDWTSVESYGMGVERYDIATTAFTKDVSLDSLREKLLFTHVYTDNPPTWKTELSGEVVDGHKLTVMDALDSTYDKAFNNLFIKYKERYNTRTREQNNGTWFTTHSNLYNLNDKSFVIAIQERLGTLFEFSLDNSPNVKIDGKTIKKNKDNQIYADKEGLELDKVDNTSDLDKPVSTATKKALDTKPDKEITSENGKALLFNEVDGGGAKYEKADGSNSYVGVHNEDNGIGVQLYDVDKDKKGVIVDITNKGAYYTKGDFKSAKERDVDENELVVKKDLKTKADLPGELPPELKVPGVDYPWFMISLLPKGVDAEGKFNFEHSGYNFNTKQYYTWKDQSIPMAATDKSAGFLLPSEKDKIKEIDNKVDKLLVSETGKSRIFNELDGGGSKYEHVDGTESFVGVNNGGENGLAAQIYADRLVDGKWQGSKLDVSNKGIYYTVGNKSATERMVPENEIATKGDLIGLDKYVGSKSVAIGVEIEGKRTIAVRLNTEEPNAMEITENGLIVRPSNLTGVLDVLVDGKSVVDTTSMIATISTLSLITDDVVSKISKAIVGDNTNPVMEKIQEIKNSLKVVQDSISSINGEISELKKEDEIMASRMTTVEEAVRWNSNN